MDYLYEQITPGSPQIRLLSLLPGTHDSAVRCSVRTVSLDDEPVYATVSYAWGDPTVTKSIFIDDRRLEITSNLEAALRHLRHERETVVLWADAVCINQADLEEKTLQVTLMREIYRRCSHVYLWLGTREDNSESATNTTTTTTSSTSLSAAGTGTNADPLALLKHFADDKHIHDLPGFTYDADKQEYSFQPNDAFTAMWEAFFRVALNRWWFRVWTVQEAALPSNAIMVYGTLRWPWALMTAARENRLRHRWTACCARDERLFRADWTQTCDEFFNKVHYIAQNRKGLVAGRYYPFRRTAFVYGGKEALDPRDKIIGLLGLSDPSGFRGFVPNYERSTREIYVSAFRAMLDEVPGHLECLVGSGFDVSATTLPSWVPDFARTIDPETSRRQMSRYNQYKLYNAPGGREPQISHDDVNLRIKGCKVGVVGEVSRLKHRPLSNDLRVLVTDWMDFTGSGSGSDSGPHEKKQEARQTQFWRTLVADAVYYPQTENLDIDKWVRFEEADVDIPAVEAWLEDPHAALTDAMLISLRCAVFNRAMMVTEDGTLGLCPCETQAGDEIWVLYGAKVPFVLRPLDTGAYRRVGDCYFDGMMDGQAVKGDEVEEQIVTLN